jgi:hypothetical protein
MIPKESLWVTVRNDEVHRMCTQNVCISILLLLYLITTSQAT